MGENNQLDAVFPSLFRWMTFWFHVSQVDPFAIASKRRLRDLLTAHASANSQGLPKTLRGPDRIDLIDNSDA